MRYFIEALFRVENVGGTSILMLPLAFSLGTLVNGFILWVFFCKAFGISKMVVARTLRQSFYASVVMGFVAYQFLGVLDDVFDINTFLGIFAQGALAGVLGIAAGLLVLRFLKNEELGEVWRSLHRRFWQTKPIVPDQNEL